LEDQWSGCVRGLPELGQRVRRPLRLVKAGDEPLVPGGWSRGGPFVRRGAARIPPSGRGEQDHASSWSYNHSNRGSQVISVISVKTLIKTAAAHGERPVNGQGYHFKLQLSQDPQKHKTFWVNCQLADLSIAKHASLATVALDGQGALYVDR
jgi:hypothetical protein